MSFGCTLEHFDYGVGLHGLGVEPTPLDCLLQCGRGSEEAGEPRQDFESVLSRPKNANALPWPWARMIEVGLAHELTVKKQRIRHERR